MAQHSQGVPNQKRASKVWLRLRIQAWVPTRADILV